jgi:hypothetical protein
VVWHWSDAVQTTGGPLVQVPLWQVSPVVHAFPSLHGVPFEATGLEQVPVDGLHVPGVVHWPAAVQTTGFDPTQVPLWQVSVWVHASPSLHVVPLDATGFEHVPVEGLHVPAVWHWSDAVQTTELPAVHVPFWQVSFKSQRLPSLHAVPFAATGFEQTPVLGLHVPAVLHCPAAVHTTGFDPTHAPFWHWSVWVQASESLQAVPFGALGLEQTPVLGLHVPAVLHCPAAVQTTGFDPTHAPFSHWSVWVQASESLHAVPFGAFGFEQTPVLGLHVPATLQAPDAVHVTPAQRFVPASPLPPSVPKPSWNVIVAPEFIRTCAAASAPVSPDVSTVTLAFVAMTSAWSFEPELRLMPFDVSR